MTNFKGIAQKIAKSRMLYLFHLANEVFPENSERANHYADLAMRYAQRAKIKIPKEWKHRICHKCKRFLYPGINCRVRLQSRKGKASHLTVTCLECNHQTRYFIHTKNQNI
ncbi:MAG: ribonuclease P protein component 4 [Promethearchaeati archaeon]